MQKTSARAHEDGRLGARVLPRACISNTARERSVLRERFCRAGRSRHKNNTQRGTDGDPRGTRSAALRRRGGSEGAGRSRACAARTLRAPLQIRTERPPERCGGADASAVEFYCTPRSRSERERANCDLRLHCRDSWTGRSAVDARLVVVAAGRTTNLTLKSTPQSFREEHKTACARAKHDWARTTDRDSWIGRQCSLARLPRCYVYAAARSHGKLGVVDLVPDPGRERAPIGERSRHGSQRARLRSAAGVQEATASFLRSVARSTTLQTPRSFAGRAGQARNER